MPAPGAAARLGDRGPNIPTVLRPAHYQRGARSLPGPLPVDFATRQPERPRTNKHQLAFVSSYRTCKERNLLE
jgi:hypothetical protein